MQNNLHIDTQPCSDAHSTIPSFTRAVPVQRALGRYPPGSLTSIYATESVKKSFMLDAHRGLVAGRDLNVGQHLGYLQGYAFTYNPGVTGVKKLGHEVFLDQTGPQGNLLQHIGSTMIQSLVNVSCDDNGLVVCTKPITAFDNFLLLQQTPVVTNKSTTEGKDWLISNMEDAFNEK
jgi:hypothetical protein